MILFNSDWDLFPSAIPDLKTTNESFLRLASIYRDSMGISNCAFILALLQPELSGLDAHSPFLTDEQKYKIGLECKYNPWYYFREVVRIPPTSGNVPSPFLANRGNIALIWSFLCHVDIAVIQPRQTGKSVGADCLNSWLMYFGMENTKIFLVTKDDQLRCANIERLKAIRDLHPPYLLNVSKLEADNKVGLTYKAKGNVYLTAVGQNSESAANNTGRGITACITQFDEPPFTPYIGTTMPASLAAGNEARAGAEKNGQPYGNVFTTTAGKRDDRDGRYMYDIIFGGAPWTEKFFDCTGLKQLYEIIDKACTGKPKRRIINCTLSHRQVGKTDEWLYKAISNAGGTPDSINRDFFNRWTFGTQSSPLSTKLNAIIMESEVDPEYIQITKDLYTVKWYIPEEEIERRMQEGYYVMGMDTSDAVGRDGISMVLIDIRDLSVVAATVINETNLITFSGWVADFLIRYRNVLWIPERRSSGMAIIDAVILRLHAARIDPFKRIFNYVIDQRNERERDYKTILTTSVERRSDRFYDAWKRDFGFNTTGASRDVLYGVVLQNTAKKAGHLVKDRTLSNEIRGLVIKNNRIDHTSGNHDDCVIAWLLACWTLFHGRNLDWYGIDSRVALSLVTDETRTITEDELILKETQAIVKGEIETVAEQLKKTTNPILVSKLEHRLRSLSEKIVNTGGQAITVDGLIKEAQETRLQSVRINRRNSLQTPNRSLGGFNRNGVSSITPAEYM